MIALHLAANAAVIALAVSSLRACLRELDARSMRRRVEPSLGWFMFWCALHVAVTLFVLLVIWMPG